MQVKSVELVKKARNKGQFPQGELPEIAFCGRSNVGKSSLLNSLLGRKKLAPTSGTPGKTRTIDFYLVNNRFYFVDLPGYGFARVSKEMKEKWKNLIEGYLQERSNLKLVIMLVDIRHDTTENDILMYNWLSHYDIPVMVTATKADKLSRSRVQKSITNIRKELELQAYEENLLIPYSSKTGQGREQLWRILNDFIDKKG